MKEIPIMFYCDKCADTKGWKKLPEKCMNKCQVCGEITACNEAWINLTEESPKYAMAVFVAFFMFIFICSMFTKMHWHNKIAFAVVLVFVLGAIILYKYISKPKKQDWKDLNGF